MKMRLYQVCLLVGMLLPGTMTVSAAAQTVEVEPFTLADVRLLPGPFKDRQDLNHLYLTNCVNSDSLLAPFLSRAGLEPKAPRYGGWEGAAIAGHGLGHYLSALSAMYAQTGDPAVKARVDYIVSELARVQAKNGNGFCHTVPQEVYEKIRGGNFTVGRFDINNCWVPNYSLHKIFAGLRDAYRLAGCRAALEVERKLGDWYYGVVQNLDPAARQKLLGSEWGGLNETFAQLAADTGDAKFLALARDWFDDRPIFDPLRKGEDKLDNLHANTQVPKIVGLAALYEADGNAPDRAAVETFWNSVVNRRSFANGGHSNNEHFHRVDKFAAVLGNHNCETCNINNMIRLTGHLFSWAPKAAEMDFVERATLNQLLVNFGRKPGEFGYFLSQAPVGEKVFSTPVGAWWCCVGTGMENPEHYAELAYFHRGDTLWVNLYLACRLAWRDQGVTLDQVTRFPEEEAARFVFHAAAPRNLALRFRKPSWCAGFTVSVNGAAANAAPDASGYVEIRRTWKDGDRIDLALPMSLHVQPLPNCHESFAAFLYGPLVLVGIVPTPAAGRDFAKDRWDDHLLAPGRTDESAMCVVTDSGLAGTVARIEKTGPLAFRTRNLLRPRDLELRPWYQVYEEHYTVYFPVTDARGWAAMERKMAEESRLAAEARARVTDTVEPGFQQSEVNHAFAGEYSDIGDFRDRKYRHATGRLGWFAYTVEVDPARPMELVAIWYGGDDGRVFDILVDGHLIATETLNAKTKSRDLGQGFYEKAYAVPPALTAGKKTVTVRIQGNARTSWAGGLFGLTVRRAAPAR